MWQGIGQFIYNYQTLITGILALFAAYIAIRPVQQQLRVSRLQSAIMAREVLLQRVQETEKRRYKIATNLVAPITNDLLTEIYRNDPDGAPQIDPNWAFNAEAVAGNTITALRKQQASKIDIQSIDDQRDILIQHVDALRLCLNEIHFPYSSHLDDPDGNLSAEEVKKMEAVANAKAEIAEKLLPDRISAVEKSSLALDNEFAVTIDKLRNRIRRIDDLILKQDDKDD